MRIMKSFLKFLLEESKSSANTTNQAAIKSLPNIYHTLTPINTVDLSEYENALLYALKVDDIKNIAHTGPYGSGKSSLLKTFEKKYDRQNFL